MKYIIYCRKSTDTEDKQVLSLDSQENELLQISKANNFKIVRVLKESKSAKEPGRPVFNQMIKMIDTGKADSILCWKIDRLTRNPIDGGQIQWRLQQGMIKTIKTFEKIYLPGDNVLLMSIEQAMATQYIRELSVNVKRGNRAKLERGEWPNHAPFGYLNYKPDKSIIIDPVRSKYVIRGFELYLTGTHGFKDISDILYDEGLRTISGRKVLKSHIQRIIQNPFYSGIMVRDGKYYEGKHQPLISKDTFDRARAISDNRSRPRPQLHFFPLRGFLKCENCGCALTASIHKGHHYYYCTNGRQHCEEHKSYLREKYLYDQVGDILGNLAFTERKIELMYKAAKERTNLDGEYIQKAMNTLQTQLESLKTKESRLLDAFLSEQIAKELYDQKTLEMQNEGVSLEKKIKEVKSKEAVSTLEPVKKIFLQGNTARSEFLVADDYKKHEILKNLLWNLSIKDKKVASILYKTPYEILAKTPKNGNISMMLSG